MFSILYDVVEHIVFSEQFVGTQDNLKTLPGEIVTEVAEIIETDIATEQKVETEIQESNEPPTAPG